MEKDEQAPAKTFSRDVYADKGFWNERFKDEKHMFDWYVSWKQLKKYFIWLLLPKTARILVVGCGNSRLTQDMYRDGWQNLVNIDISDEVIKKMRDLHDKAGVICEWIEMDATQMSFPDHSFDLVVDKGTLDAVLCGTEFTIPNKILREMVRVVKPERSVLLVTHGNVANRKFLFESNFHPEQVSVLCHKQDLSPEVNLINAMRSMGKDKSLQEVFKDEALLKEVFAMLKRDEQSAEAEAKKSGWVKVDFEHMNIIQKSDQQAAEPQEGEGDEQVKTKIVTKVDDGGYNPPRQNHCFLYFLKKLPATAT